MTRTLKSQDARSARPQRAFSLLELTLVLAVIGVLSAMAVTRFGADALSVADGEGVARKLMLDLRQARRRTITTGVDHYLQLTRTAGQVTGFAVCQSGGALVDDARTVPTGVTITSAADQWTFGFDGALQSGGGSSTMTVDGGDFQWLITCYHATGAVRCDKTLSP